MSNTTIIKTENNYTIMSTEVAQMVEKKHSELLKDIRRYQRQINEANEQEIGQGKIDPSSFFAESTYKNQQNKEQPCYLVTKQGCEFIAHKMTGVKGTAFTAKYILRFHEMEQALQNQYLPQTQNTTTSVLPPAKPNWYERNQVRIKKICDRMGWQFKHLYHKILKECGEKYDLEQGKRIHRKNEGYDFEYAIDIVSYFPELSELADNYLDYMEENYLK